MRGAEPQGIGKGYWLYTAKHSRSFKINGGSFEQEVNGK